MADMISAGDAKNILGCDDATLNNHINNGSIRAQRVDGQLQVNHEDVLRLSTGSESDDDGTLILASESDDFSIDLGEVIDDSAATMVHGAASDDAQITFNDNDGLEMPDLDGEATQDMGTTGATSDLSFTESNTAVVTSVDETMVDETMVDQTAADLQTVDYGDTNYDQNPRRSSARVSQRSVRSQRVEFEEDDVHIAWPILMGLSLLIMVFTIPYIYMMSYPVTTTKNGEKLTGTTDTMFTNMAASVAGFSVEPNPKLHNELNPPDNPHVPMGSDVDPEANIWRHEQWQKDADTIEERLKHFTIREVTLDDNGKPVSAITEDNQSVTVREITAEVGAPNEIKQQAKNAFETTISY